MCLWVPLLSLLVSLLLYTVTALWIMYRSTQAPFDAHCRHDDVATALIRGICKMQLAVRIDKRPGESHMALDGKKSSTSYDLASIFRGRRSTLDRWTGKITKRIGTSLSALHSTFHF